MSIGSNCACLGFLGDERIRGPVDNIICLSDTGYAKNLFEGSIIDEIINNPPLKKISRKK